MTSSASETPPAIAGAAPPPAASISPARRLARALTTHHRLILALLLFAVFVATRLAYIGADPPLKLPNGVRIYELFTDPPAKSYEARNWALFGEWSLSPLDNYRFWRVQAPAWVYPIAGFYRLFGAGYVQMRIFSTLCSSLGLLAILAFAGQKLKGWSFFLAGSFLTFNYYYLVFSRSGLLESLINTYLALAILFTYLAQRRLAWALAAQWAIVLAFFTKMTGLYLLPIVVVGSLVAYVRHLKQGVPRWLKIAPPLQAALILALVSAYVFRPEYWRTVTWNFGHAMFDNGGIEAVEITKLPVSAALQRLLTRSYWDSGFFSLFPVAGFLASLQVVRLSYLAVRRRIDAWELLVLAWFVSSFAVLALTPLLWVHYRLIIFPPVVLLASSLIHAASTQPWLARRAWLTHLVALAVLSIDLTVHGTWIRRMVANRAYAMSDAVAVLREHTGNEGGTFAGMWAGPLVFDTKHKWFYVKDLFNNSAEAQASLGINHLVDIDKGDLANALLMKRHPMAMRSRKMLVQFDLRGHQVSLYRLQTPISDATIFRR